MTSQEYTPQEEIIPSGGVSFWLAVGTSLFHLILNYLILLPENWSSALHFCLMGTLASLLYFRSRILQAAIPVILTTSSAYLILFEEALYERGQSLNSFDYVAAISSVVLGLFLTGRAIGWFIPAMITIFFTYTVYWGRFLGGVFHFPGLSLENMVFRTYFGPDGMFGSIAQLSWSSVYMFVLFGAFLQVSGAGSYLIRMSTRLTSRVEGGSGLVAVTASALMGSVSGSAIANTAATGVITIPGMRKVGYAPEYAAGIEAAASTGGQLMPPIMGAGAFVMASFTQLPYQQIIGAALLPALLYYISLAFYVRAYAVRQRIDSQASEKKSQGEEEASPDRNEWRHLLSLALLVGALVMGYSPLLAVGTALVGIVVLSQLSLKPMRLKEIAEALALGARGMVVTGLLLVVIGILVNVITTTGLGNTFSLMAVQWSGGKLLILLILVAVASLILGAGLPVTASYIVVATLMGSVLTDLISSGLIVRAIQSGQAQVSLDVLHSLLPSLDTDLTLLGTALQEAPPDVRQLIASMTLSPSAIAGALLSAHLIIFWFSQDSNVTPPVCLVAYTAAGIAKASHIRTGIVAWRFAKALYIVPLLMAYSGIIAGDLTAKLMVMGLAIPGFFGIVAAFEGVLVRPISVPIRILCGLAGTALLWPSSGTLIDSTALVGLGILISLDYLNIIPDKRR